MRRFLSMLFAASIAAFALAVTAGAQQSYTDPGGDAGPGTDITSVTVNNDQAGMLTIQVASASPIVGNHAVAVFIDADKNPATGDDGIEAWMFGGPFVGAAFLSCSASGCSESNPAFGARCGGIQRDRVPVQSLRHRQLGELQLRSRSASASTAGPNVNFWDVAGTYTYDLVFPQSANAKDDDAHGRIDADDLGCSSTTDDNEADDPVNIRLEAGEGGARVGRKPARSATISAATTRVETGQPLESGSVACTARTLGKKLKGSGSVVAGNATCRIKLPAAAKGKIVRGTMTLTYKTASAKSAFSFKAK